jgi:hypothetical protein
MAPQACVATMILPACLAQTPVSQLRIDANNFVLYNYDTFDMSKFGTVSSPTNVMMVTYNFHIAIADITAVNGAPAKGALLCRTMPMFVLSPTPAHGTQAIADTSRSMTDDCSAEIMTAAGTPVGTIYYSGLYGGAPPPGAPVAATRSNMIVTGGTGVFLGVRGQAGQTTWSPRVASVSEDPANRRINGGGAQTVILQLLPMFSPQVLLASGTPAVVHSSDYSLVTSAKPAKAGEILVLYASGLGPTSAVVDYGQPFPKDPAPVTAPVSVSVNGNVAPAIYAGSYPGAVDAYQVNFQVPSGFGPGVVPLQLSAGFITGSAVTIPIQ